MMIEGGWAVKNAERIQGRGTTDYLFSSMKAMKIRTSAHVPLSSGKMRTDESVRLQDPHLAAVMSDDGVAEALRRNAEMSSDPSIGISLRDFERRVRRLV
jgi:hypothetical protein